MIRHTVVFKLKHPAGSVPEHQFLADIGILATLPGVTNYECLRQTSGQNSFTFAISMAFASQAEYDVYGAHPLHHQFIRERWIPEVDDYLELDYRALH